MTASSSVPEDVQSRATQPAPVRIKVIENGPLQVKGPIELLDHDGNTYATRRTTLLCRCGKSSTKPFCDGTHARDGFSAVERAGGSE